jgi:hypothetical protein
MATLNKGKPYGISCGDQTHAFVQDGKRFNSAGQEVDEKGRVVVSKTVVTPPKEAAKGVNDEQLKD